MLARQHAFGGFGRYGIERLVDRTAGVGEAPGAGGGGGSTLVCTRHHAIDWNFVGWGRPRPNKWRVVPAPSADGGARADDAAVDSWYELSYAADGFGSPYYYERWARLSGGVASPSLALRSRAVGGGGVLGMSAGGGVEDGVLARDALVMIVGDHFGYVISRPVGHEQLSPLGKTLQAVVDEAVWRGERSLAEACLLLEAGHGRVSAGWQVDASLQPWRIGQTLAEIFGGDRQPERLSQGSMRIGSRDFDVLCESE